MKDEIFEEKPRSGKAAFLIILGVLVVIGLFFLSRLIFNAAASGDEPENAAAIESGEGAEEEVVFAVNTTSVILGPISDYFRISGEIVAASSVETYADAQGILARMYVELGDYVRAGDVIAEVDPSRPGISYALSPVKARVSGTITSLPLDRGDAVTAQISVATIGDLTRLQAKTAIPERFVSRIREGMKAEVSLEAWPGHVIPLTVTEVDPVMNNTSRTLGISMDIPPGNTRVKAGMYADILLVTDEKEQVLKVPADTVLRRLGEVFVYVVNGDKAEKRLVVPGITLDGWAEILNGLSAGDNVVYQGQTLLEDGVNVRVIRDVNLGDSQ